MEDIFEIKNHGLENFLIYWVKEKKNVEANAVDAIRTSHSVHIEALKEVEEEGKYGFQYNIAYKATLRKYLMQQMGKTEVLKLLKTMIEAIQYLKKNGVNETYLYLNLDYIFVDFVTREISFLCIPESREMPGNKSFREFLKELLMSISYQEEEDIYYIGKLVLYVSNNSCIETENFEELVLSLEEVKLVQNNSKPQTSTMAAQAAAPLPMSIPAIGTPLSSGPIAEKEEMVIGNQPKPIKLEAAKPAPSGSLIAQPKIGEHDETTVLTTPSGTLKEPPKAKRTLFQRAADKKPTPTLIRTKNQEKIVIDKNVFRIGKAKTDTEYTIEDNVAISRIHAIIHKKDGACYLRDNDSTNNTYVNGAILKGEKEQLLMKGMKISLADEEFIFELL